MALRCPKCRTAELTELSVKKGDVKVDCCPDCKGVWFDAKELEAMMGVAAKKLRVPSHAGRQGRICPRCVRPLFAFKYPQTLVTVDMCRKCGGLWLDSAEFEEIRAIRTKLAEKQELEERSRPTGAKGALVRFIDTAMSALRPR